jgi:hypothetical protein
VYAPAVSGRGIRVGIDDVEGNGHYAGKRRQEALVVAGPIPFTIQRTTQFHEFAEMVVSWTRDGDSAIVPPLLVQPVAARDVAEVMAELAVGSPAGRATDLAGPSPEEPRRHGPSHAHSTWRRDPAGPQLERRAVRGHDGRRGTAARSVCADRLDQLRDVARRCAIVVGAG